MNNQNLKNWIKVTSEALKFNRTQFTFKGHSFEFQIFEFEETKMGYLTIWNVSTRKAFTISRMKIDESILIETVKVNKHTMKESSEIPDDLIFSKKSNPF